MSNTKENETLYSWKDDLKNFETLENGWWCYTYTYLHNQCHDGKEESNIHEDDRLHVNNPFLCNMCGFVWTKDIDSRRDKNGIKCVNSILLEDFPKYGLQYKTCYFCVPEKERNNVESI